MQTQPEPAAPFYDQQGAMGENKLDEETSGKKSMLKKVKDKAKKLKSKVKKPKSPGSANAGTVPSSGSSSTEEESGSEPQQQVGDDGKHDRDMPVNPGLQGDAFEAVPDPHATDATAGIGGMEKQFGQMGMDDRPDASKLQDQVPSAAGGASAGLTSYLASRDPGQSPYATGSAPVDEGTDAEGRDLLVAPTTTDSKEPAAMDEEKSPAAWYTPTAEEKTSEEDQEQKKPLTDRVTEGAAATAAAGAAAVGLKGLSDNSERTGSKDIDVCENTETKDADASPPTFTERATGLKDTMPAKLGYGSNQNLPAEEDRDMAPMQAGPQDLENKSVLDKVKDNAAGTTEAVTTKLGYGEGDATKSGDDKTYTQKAYDAAYGAKDAVASKLGYGSTDPSADNTAEGEQKSYLQGAKEAVATKLGYENKDLPVSTEGTYGDEQNTPASTAARFHPGDEDTALSQLITDKLSTGAATVKDTLMRSFGSPKSGSPTPGTTPPPSSAAGDPVHKEVSEETEGLAPEKEPAGMVGKVTGAVTSLLGSSPGSEKNKREEETLGKANEDTQAVEIH